MEVSKDVISKISPKFVPFLVSLLGPLYAKRDKYKDAIIVVLNREQASKLLELNIKNRKVLAANFKLLKNEMNEGNYRDTGACIVIYWDLILGDGQHRLKAFLASDLDTIEVTLRWGDWYDDRFAVTDQGKKRATHEAINEDKLHVTICKFAHKFVFPDSKVVMGNVAWAKLCEKTRKAFNAMHDFDIRNLNKQMFRSPMCTAFCLYYTVASNEIERRKIAAVWKKMLAKTTEDGSPGNQNFNGALASTYIDLEKNNDLVSDKERHKCFYLSCMFFDKEFENNGYKVNEGHKKRINDMFKVLR